MKKAKSHFFRAVALGSLLAGMPFLASCRKIDTAAETQPSRVIVTWGDSIGNGIGISLQEQGATVINLGVDGAGLKTSTHVEPLDHMPRGAVVLMSVGTNDVPFAMCGDADQAQIDAYARQVVGLARDVRNQGATPVIIGMQAPFGPYTDGTENWYLPGFVDEWTDAMKKMNAAIEKECRAQGIAWSPVQARVSERRDDHLHYTEEGYLHIARNAFKDAGIADETQVASNGMKKARGL